MIWFMIYELSLLSNFGISSFRCRTRKKNESSRSGNVDAFSRVLRQLLHRVLVRHYVKWGRMVCNSDS
jgi:hypothetical protein